MKNSWGESTATWTTESKIKFVIQFLKDPYDCKKSGMLKPFKKISNATGHEIKECCQFFHDNMCGYRFFDVLAELKRHHNKDRTVFKPGNPGWSKNGDWITNTIGQFSKKPFFIKVKKEISKTQFIVHPEPFSNIKPEWENLDEWLYYIGKKYSTKKLFSFCLSKSKKSTFQYQQLQTFC